MRIHYGVTKATYLLWSLLPQQRNNCRKKIGKKNSKQTTYFKLFYVIQNILRLCNQMSIVEFTQNGNWAQ